jgi:hypothetical protein
MRQVDTGIGDRRVDARNGLEPGPSRVATFFFVSAIWPLSSLLSLGRQSDMVIGDRCGDARLLKQRGVIVDSDCEW